jgi:hypothetical protein
MKHQVTKIIQHFYPLFEMEILCITPALRDFDLAALILA